MTIHHRPRVGFCLFPSADADPVGNWDIVVPFCSRPNDSRMGWATFSGSLKALMWSVTKLASRAAGHHPATATVHRLYARQSAFRRSDVPFAYRLGRLQPNHDRLRRGRVAALCCEVQWYERIRLREVRGGAAAGGSAAASVPSAASPCFGPSVGACGWRAGVSCSRYGHSSR